MKITFSSVGNSFNSLYNILIDAYNSDDFKKYNRTFDLGEISVTLKGSKLLGRKYLTVLFDDVDAIWTLQIKEVNELFGKPN